MRRFASIAPVFATLLAVAFVTVIWSQSTCGCLFKRGDANGDFTVNGADISYITNDLFLGGDDPCNFDSADVNDDGAVGVSDASYLASYLFLGGEAPPDPGATTAGCDCTEDDLEICCSPDGGTTTVTGATGTATGSTKFDNNAGPATNGTSITLTSSNDANCAHANSQTKWDITYAVSDSEIFQKEAIDDGCLDFGLSLSASVTWQRLTPCFGGGGSGFCKNGDNYLFADGPWFGAKIICRDASNQDYELNVTFSNSITCSVGYEQVSPNCALSNFTNTPTGAASGITLYTGNLPEETCLYIHRVIIREMHHDFIKETGDLAYTEGVSATYTLSGPTYNWCPQ